MTNVEFPGLWGWNFTIDRVAFSIGNYQVYWYGLIIATGLLLGLLLALKNCEKYQLKKDDIVDFLIITVPVAVVSARLYYVLFKWDEFSGDFYKIINIRQGGLAIYGAVLGSIVCAYTFTKYRKIQPLKFFDFLSMYLLLGQAIGRWGNFINQEAFGRNTTLPWGMKSEITSMELTRLKEIALDAKARGLNLPNMEINLNLDPNIAVHPTFLYESIGNFILFVILGILIKRKKFDGEVFAWYMAGYGLIRFFVEGLRTDSLMYGSFRISQVAALLFALSFILFILYRRLGILNRLKGNKG